MMVHGGFRLALLVFLLAALASCADTPQRVTSRSPDKPPRPAAKAPPSARQIVDQARSHMLAGDYQKALDVYHAGHRKAPRDQTLLGAYVQSLESMVGTAEQALAQQEVGTAGKIYALLKKNYPRFEGFEQKLSFNRTRLSAKLDDCKKKLFKQGFKEYRKGNLDRAIALWEDLLVIDPQNTDIKEALRIAKLQQKNLQETD